MQDAPKSASGGAAPSFLITLGLLLFGGVACMRIAERLRLPRLTALMLWGLLLGAPMVGLVTPEVRSWLGVAERSAGCVIAFSIGALLRWDVAIQSARILARFIVCTLLVVIPLCALVAAWALPTLGLGNGAKVVAVLAITLAAVSPTVVVAVADELRADGPLTRTALASTVVADFALLVLLIALSFTLSLASPEAPQALGLVRSLGGALAAGLVLGLLLTRVRRLAGAEVLAVVAVGAFVVSAKLHQSPVAWLASSVALGVAASSAGGDTARDLAKLARAALPIAAMLLFGLEGLLLDPHLLLSLALPAGALVVARAMGIWVGARAGFRARDTDPMIRRWVFAAFLPQAGFALGLVGLLPTLFPSFGEAVRALAVGVVGINELLMPPVLRFALAAAGEAGSVEIEAEATG